MFTPRHSMLITCIGIDLTWSPRNPTGGAVIHADATGGRLADTTTLQSDAEIVAYIEQHAPTGPALVAVDAPLVVPNATGRRPAEAELGRVFARYQAGAHSANRQLFKGEIRGEALVAALEGWGFVHAPAIAAGVATRQVTEVYPHAAMIRLFGLSRTLKYKYKSPRRRSHTERLAAWRTYQQHMRDLSIADPPLQGQEGLLTQDVGLLAGNKLKAYEDQVDAVLCAYIALYGFRWGAARCRTFGTLEEGYIFTPVPEGEELRTQNPEPRTQNPEPRTED